MSCGECFLVDPVYTVTCHTFVEQGNNFKVFPRCCGSTYRNLKVGSDLFKLNGTVFFRGFRKIMPPALVGEFS